MTEDGSIFGLGPKASGADKKPGKKPRRKSRGKGRTKDSDQPLTAEKEFEAVAAGMDEGETPKTPEKTSSEEPGKDANTATGGEAPEDGEKKPAKKPAARKRRAPRKKPVKAAEPTEATEELQAEAGAESEAQAEEKPKPKPKSRSRSRSKAKPKTEAKTEQKPEPKPESKAGTEDAPAPATEAQETPQDNTPSEAPTEDVSYETEFAAATPDEVIAPEDELPEATLETLPDHLREACVRAGWDKLMPVQALAVPYLMAGRDLMIQSRTGSGKTGSFLLPILHRVDVEKAECQALVLVPTRELAQQVAREAEMLSGDMGVRVAAVYGGAGYGPQLEALRAGAHIVVGTPGRVLDHLLRRSLTLDGIQVLVFDEADRMLSIGFYPDMREVQRYLPKRKVGMFMTSATYPPHVMRLAGEFMEKPQILSLSHKRVHVAETPHLYYECNAMEKDRALVRIIEMENPASAFIFCNTKQNVHYVTAVLQRFGYDADELSGDLTQNKREQVLARIRKGELRFLVATDVAARGIDIPDLSHVFLYEPPEDHEVYIHRAGRTGRAGASGEVISLVDVMEKLALERIGKMYSITLEKSELPTDEDVEKVVAERMTALLESRLRKLDNVQRERIRRFRHLSHILADGPDDGLDLLGMLLDDIYTAELQAAPPKPPSKNGGNGGNGNDRGGKGGNKGGRGQRSDNGAPRGRKPAPAKAAPEENRTASGNDEGQEASDAPKKPRRRRRRRRRPRTSSGGGGEVNGNK